jgi:hypothetical protein
MSSPVRQLSRDLTNASSDLAQTFASSLSKTFAGLELDQVEIAMEFSADGKVSIVGSGVGVKGSASMKLKFVRRRSRRHYRAFY